VSAIMLLLYEPPALVAIHQVVHHSKISIED
jgi:hypothetical protein